MTDENITTPSEKTDERETWVQPNAAKFRAGEAETSGGNVNETGFS